MDWIWGSGGTTLFDVYSLHHIVWFIAITTILFPVFREKVWMAAAAIAFIWEVFEYWVVIRVPHFPFAGREDLINKIVGDTISDFVGFLIAFFIIRSLLRKKENG